MIGIRQRPKFATKVARLAILIRRYSDKPKAPKVPKVKMYNGQTLPGLGFGTWQSPPGVVAQAVKDAIDVGYRHIDCAHIYGNEKEVGEGIFCKIDEGVVRRGELHITSKIWNTYHRPDLVRCACETSLENLNTPYLDLYLIHWPMAYKEDEEEFPKDKDGKIIFSDVDYVDTWLAMENLVRHGLCKSIGLSNFNSKQIERIFEVACIPPAMLQVECHPYLNQKKLFEFAKKKKMKTTGYSPLGSPKRPWVKEGDPIVMKDETILCIAKKHKKDAAQILIRYQIQRGNIPIPKSVTKSRIASNFQVFDFKLDKDDMEAIDGLDRNGRLVPLDSATGHPHHPFEDKSVKF